MAADAVSLGPGATDVAAACALVQEADFDAVYDRWFDFVWRNVRRLGVPEAEVDDAVQEVFLVIHRKLADFEPRGSFKAWIFGIVARVARDHRRGLQRKSTLARTGETPIDPDRIASSDPGGDEALERCEAGLLLHRLLDGLDDDKRAVFVLAELEQMSAPEIAEALGTKLNTVYGRLRAARKEFDEAAARLRARDAWRLR